MRRVVITGMGIVSSLGNELVEVTENLKQAKSGISFSQEYRDLGFRSQVYGMPFINIEDFIDRRDMRFHGRGTAWNHIALDRAIKDAGLEKAEISNENTGVIMGSGGSSTRTIFESALLAQSKGPKRIGPFAVPKAMCSTASATMATFFKIKGVNYSISPIYY